MVILRINFRVDPAHRAKVIRSLARVVGPSRVSSGCVSSQLYADVEDEGRLLFVEEWSDEHSLAAHLRAENTRVLLSAVEYACDPPDVRVETLADSRGLEFIAACRETVWGD